ncbi:MAG: hypothetical protein ACRDRH_06250 [Pseudonocardia sp.]
MSARSRQGWQFGEQLGATCGVEVRVEWLGRSSGGWAGWIVQWCDGPTEVQMRAAAAAVVPRVGGSTSTVDYSRNLTTVGDATALLIWLECHPDGASQVSAVSLVAARDEVSYPERADVRTLRRARALLSRSPSGIVGYEVLRELARHARGGWAQVPVWLDEVACARVPDVIDLAGERVRRRPS